jgi:4a-hydroxytetrahydrobiopterin dehydratase
MTENAQPATCAACDGRAPALQGEPLARLHGGLDCAWRLVDEHYLERDFRFVDFKSALAFVNRTGELAERLGHHPDIQLSWGRVRLRVWTHKSRGLTHTDFVLARQIDDLV